MNQLRPETDAPDSRNPLGDVAAASAAVFCDEHLAALRASTPSEAFLLLQRFLARSLFAYAEALDGWGIEIPQRRGSLGPQ